MSYKRYIKRGNKVFGPYIYESKRVNGKVVSNYINTESKDKKRKIMGAVVLILVALTLFLGVLYLSKNSYTTGDIALNIQETYELNQNLTGVLTLQIEEGDEIQKDTEISIVLKNGAQIIAEVTIEFEDFLMNLQPVEIFNVTQNCTEIENETICENITSSDFYFNQVGSYERELQDFINYTFKEIGTYSLIFSTLSEKYETSFSVFGSKLEVKDDCDYGNASLDCDGDGTNNGVDCSPANGSFWRIVNVSTDGDGDGRCVNNSLHEDCVGAAANAGTRFPEDCLSNDDCDDAIAAAWEYKNYQKDFDFDGFCAGNVSVCSGTSVPNGFKNAENCLGDDCKYCSWSACNFSDLVEVAAGCVSCNISTDEGCDDYYENPGRKQTCSYNGDPTTINVDSPNCGTCVLGCLNTGVCSWHCGPGQYYCSIASVKDCNVGCGFWGTDVINLTYYASLSCEDYPTAYKCAYNYTNVSTDQDLDGSGVLWVDWGMPGMLGLGTQCIGDYVPSGYVLANYDPLTIDCDDNNASISSSSSCAATTCISLNCTDTCGNNYAGTMGPDRSCAANTCRGTNCTDSCGYSFEGTKSCTSGGGGGVIIPVVQNKILSDKWIVLNTSNGEEIMIPPGIEITKTNSTNLVTYSISLNGKSYSFFEYSNWNPDEVSCNQKNLWVCNQSECINETVKQDCTIDLWFSEDENVYSDTGLMCPYVQAYPDRVNQYLSRGYKIKTISLSDLELSGDNIMIKSLNKIFPIIGGVSDLPVLESQCSVLESPINENIEKVWISSCNYNFKCSNWSDCEIVSEFQDLISGVSEIKGKQYKKCIDENFCVLPKRIYQECKIKINISILKNSTNGENYIEFYNKDNGRLLSVVRDRKDRETPSLDINFLTGNAIGSFGFDNNQEPLLEDCEGCIFSPADMLEESKTLYQSNAFYLNLAFILVIIFLFIIIFYEMKVKKDPLDLLIQKGEDYIKKGEKERASDVYTLLKRLYEHNYLGNKEIFNKIKEFYKKVGRI